ncbi:MAG: D-alanyl-D-alanine carboxypeptidase/D-alanyl-D-alanine endopeptidase [Ignavibacteriaceae bacterium]
MKNEGYEKMKKVLIFVLFIIVPNAFSQSGTQELRTKIDSIYSNPFFLKSIMSVDVFDLTAKDYLYQRNEKLLVRPASNLKILTTSAGLLFLTPDYKFQTKVYYTGEIINGTLYGDLFVKGGCDPDFSSKDIEKISAEIKSLGIKEITGNLFGDVSMMDSLFWGNGWMWDDDPSTDAPYLTPLDINENSIGVLVKGTQIGEKAKVQLIPNTDFLHIYNNSVTIPADSPSTLSVTREWIDRKNNILVNGQVKQSVPDSLQDTTWLNVYNPGLYFLTLLKEHLEEKGIIIGRKIYFAVTPNYAIKAFDINRKLSDVVFNTNKISYNLGAEMILYALAAKYYGKPASAVNGIKMVDSLIALSGLSPEEYRIVDGSGVSHYNLISTETIVSVLKYFYFNHPDIFKIIYNSFPVAGIDGTLKDRMQNYPVQNNVHAKTGSLSGVASLSGFVKSKNDHLLLFSIIINDFVGHTKIGRQFQDDICNILAGINSEF